MPPTMKILLQGTAVVLLVTAAVSMLPGLAARSALVALNSVGFTGIGALSIATVFYAVALERIGLNRARNAAITLVTVLACGALAMTGLLFVLLSEPRFMAEASRFGLHSLAGIAVLTVLLVDLGVIWHDR